MCHRCIDKYPARFLLWAKAHEERVRKLSDKLTRSGHKWITSEVLD